MKRIFFSRKDGTTFIQDVDGLADNIREFLDVLPETIKEILPDVEDFARAVQAVSDAVKDGQTADIAIRAALDFIPGEKDTELYVKAKHLLEELAIRLQIVLEQGKGWDWSSAKKRTATMLTIEATNVSKLEASYAVDAAVFYLKSLG